MSRDRVALRSTKASAAGNPAARVLRSRNRNRAKTVAPRLDVGLGDRLTAFHRIDHQSPRWSLPQRALRSWPSLVRPWTFARDVVDASEVRWEDSFLHSIARLVEARCLHIPQHHCRRSRKDPAGSMASLQSLMGLPQPGRPQTERHAVRRPPPGRNCRDRPRTAVDRLRADVLRPHFR